MKVLKASIFLIILISCEDSYYWRKDFENQKFDKVVINKLSLYDTLRKGILQNYSEFQWEEKQSSLTYIYNFDTTYYKGGINHFDIPRKIRSEIIQLFSKIGQTNILGFTIYKDSLLKIYVRNTFLDEHYLDVRESLNWYPQKNKIEKLEFPYKDSLLSEKWQYEIWYDKRSEF